MPMCIPLYFINVGVHKTLVNVWYPQQLDVSPIVITPPALDGESWQRHCGETGKPYTKEEEMTTEYAHTCANTAASLKVPCIDLHTAMVNQVPLLFISHSYWLMVDACSVLSQSDPYIMLRCSTILPIPCSSTLPLYPPCPGSTIKGHKPQFHDSCHF